MFSCDIYIANPSSMTTNHIELFIIISIVYLGAQGKRLMFTSSCADNNHIRLSFQSAYILLHKAHQLIRCCSNLLYLERMLCV